MNKLNKKIKLLGNLKNEFFNFDLENNKISFNKKHIFDTKKEYELTEEIIQKIQNSNKQDYLVIQNMLEIGFLLFGWEENREKEITRNILGFDYNNYFEKIKNTEQYKRILSILLEN